MTPALPLCNTKTSLTCKDRDTAPLGVSWDDTGSGSFESCGVYGGASLLWACYSTSHGCLMGLRCGEFEDRVNALGSLVMSLDVFLSIDLQSGRVRCPAGGRCC